MRHGGSRRLSDKGQMSLRAYCVRPLRLPSIFPPVTRDVDDIRVGEERTTLLTRRALFCQTSSSLPAARWGSESRTPKEEGMLRPGEGAVPQHGDQVAPAADEAAEDREVWRAMEAEPGFRERLTKAISNMGKGLSVPYKEIRRRHR